MLHHQLTLLVRVFHTENHQNHSLHPQIRRKNRKIFYDYFVRNYSQAKIAGRRGVSRQRVQRVLADDRYRNMVEIRINLPDSIHTQLEAELENKYGMEEIILGDTRMVDCGDINRMTQALGSATAQYLMRILTDDMSISITWSKTLLEMAKEVERINIASFKTYKNVTIIQGMGAAGSDTMEFHSLEIAQRLAKAFNAKTRLIPAPMIAADAESTNKFLQEPVVRDALEAFRQTSLFLCDIGSINGESSVLRVKSVSKSQIQQLARAGAVGDINGYFFDIAGQPVVTEFDRRIVGPSRKEVFSTSRLVAVAGGDVKYDAVLAVARGKLAKVLITDYETGKKLLVEPEAR